MSNDFGLDAELAVISLKSAVINTFEDMAFIEIVEDKQIEGVIYPHILSIDIVKPVSVSIYLFLTEELKSRIINNICQDNVGSNQANDCLLEILNVISGAFLTAYFGKNVDYKMEFPQMFVNIPDEEKNYSLILNFNGEGEPVMLILNSVRYHY